MAKPMMASLCHRHCLGLGTQTSQEGWGQHPRGRVYSSTFRKLVTGWLSDFYLHCSQSKIYPFDPRAQSSADSPSSEAKDRCDTLLRSPGVSSTLLAFQVCVDCLMHHPGQGPGIGPMSTYPWTAKRMERWGRKGFNRKEISRYWHIPRKGKNADLDILTLGHIITPSWASSSHAYLLWIMSFYPNLSTLHHLHCPPPETNLPSVLLTSLIDSCLP